MPEGMTWGPTFDEMLYPEKIPFDIRRKALDAKEKDPLNPVNLFNITWKKQDGTPCCFVIPKEITGVDANIAVMYAKDFPTGSHKVGATYSVTVTKQLAGEVAPGRDIVVFPSTGNYGIGGAWVGPRMGYETVVILPEMMSKERFEKIEYYGAECIRTPGCESSVKEIYDKCWELRGKSPKYKIMNQFEVMENYIFHYHVTGNTIGEAANLLASKGTGAGHVSAFVSAMGSSGTIAAGDRLKQLFPGCLTVGLEPIQCPTLYNNGYGDHDIQGIGDKHVTWIHNVMNMDAIMCIDDIASKKGLQLLTEPVGLSWLVDEAGVAKADADEMASIFGISGVCNLLGAIKTAKRYKMTSKDLIFTICTDSIDRYHSVMEQMNQSYGKMDRTKAAVRHESIFMGAGEDYIQEASTLNRDRWFNLKYYTWVEQQGKTVRELNAQRSQDWWHAHQARVADIDRELKLARGF